jgi:tetratricopeptide (TPR) repeat protein
MAGAEGIPDLGPLPQSDENAELQRSSIKGLNSLLQGQDALIFRDERIEDYGVDGSFEVKLHGAMTNFRAKVQLKGTASLEPNQDGSVSLPVRAANLNYLLNGPSPIYLLFDAKKREFWHVWAHDEYRRLEAANPGWRQQERVTLRFSKRLVQDGLTAIVDRVLREGCMHRQIHDSLARSTTSDPLVVSIDTASLEVTNPEQAQHILLASGLAIVAAGFPREALRMLDLVDSRAKGLPRLQLTAGYADYMLGKYLDALGHIRQALVRNDELSERDRTFLGRLKDICEFRVGIIDDPTYRKRTDERARSLHGLESLEARLEAAYSRFWSERDAKRREALAAEIREATAEILRHRDATEAAKLGARLILLYVEGTCAALAVIHQVGMYRIRKAMFVAPTKGTMNDYRQAISRQATWGASSDAALREANNFGHPILIAEAIRVSVTFRLGQLLEQRLDALWLDKEFQIPGPVAGKMLQDIASASEIDKISGSIEGRLRSDIINADILEALGDLDSAKKLAMRIHPEAEAMGFENIAQRAKDLLDERTTLMEFERELKRFKSADQDGWFSDVSDEELREFGRETLEAMGLPSSRLRVMEQYCESLRHIARERCHWCRHLQMLEDLTQTQDRATAFIALPNRRCICEKFGYGTNIVTSDAQALIGAFKRLYCAGCKDRSPKQE